MELARQLQDSLADAEHDYDDLDVKYQELILAASEHEERAQMLAYYNRVLTEHLQEFVEV